MIEREHWFAIAGFAVVISVCSGGLFLSGIYTSTEAILTVVALITGYISGTFNTLERIRDAERRRDDDELDSLFYSGSPGQISADRERGKP